MITLFVQSVLLGGYSAWLKPVPQSGRKDTYLSFATPMEIEIRTSDWFWGLAACDVWAFIATDWCSGALERQGKISKRLQMKMKSFGILSFSSQYHMSITRWTRTKEHLWLMEEEAAAWNRHSRAWPAALPGRTQPASRGPGHGQDPVGK